MSRGNWLQRELDRAESEVAAWGKTMRHLSGLPEPEPLSNADLRRLQGDYPWARELLEWRTGKRTRP